MSAPTSMDKVERKAAAAAAAAAARQKNDGSLSTSTNKAKKAMVDSSAAVTLTVPTIQSDPTPHLAPFKDESSAYAVVAKSCLQLTSYAGSGSSVQIEDATCAAQSALFHDASYARILSECFKALTECIRNHKDRRCRILACQTLAILARTAYARIRHSHILFSQRDATLSRLEDEVCEAATALVTAALEDEDDGVSACAVESLGIMALSSTATAGTLVEDELLREMQSIAFGRVSAYAPTLRCVAEEDPAIPLCELQTRIYENILGPRLLQLVDRIMNFASTGPIHITLPCLTACLVHQVKTAPSLLFNVDAQTYAKRWMDLDAIGLVDIVVTSLLLPLQQAGLEGGLARTAALSAVRLAHVCSSQPWVSDALQWAVVVLKEEATAPAALETKMGTLAALLVALRGIPLRDRTGSLIWMIDQVAALPSTTMAPLGIVSPGLLVEWQNSKSYRRPARIGFWTEIALSFFMDGPDPDTNVRHECLSKFFSSPSFAVIRGEKNKGFISSLYEILLAFTSVALDTGRRFRVNRDGTMLSMDPNAPEVDQWLNLAWVVLSTFVFCVHTETNSAFLNEDLTLANAGLVGYVRLLQEYIHFVGLILPVSSVALKLTPNACPPHLLWDQMAESASFLAKFEADDLGELEKTSMLMDEIVAREKQQGIPSHYMRLFLLSLAADHWVQGRVTNIRKQFESNSSNTSNFSLDVQSGREIVLALSPKRMLMKIFDGHVPPIDTEGKKRKDPVKRLAFETVRVCVACIENIALTACDWRRRFGSSEDVKHLVSVSVGVLQGKADDTPVDDNMRAVLTPLCQAAVDRVQAFYNSEGSGGMDPTFPVSELVTHPVKPKIKPLVSSSKPLHIEKDNYQLGYLMQIARQIVSCRTDQCIQAFPPADYLYSSSRPKNWLRLAIPPVPKSKDARNKGIRVDALAAWGKVATISSASSDPISLTLAYCPRRVCRYDSEDEFRISVVVRVFNVTAIQLMEGLCLELGIVQRPCDMTEREDSTSLDIIESLGGQLEDVTGASPLLSSTVTYKQELKAGDHVTWEIALNHIVATNNLALMPSVVFRNVEEEANDAGVKWVSEKSGGSVDGRSVTTGIESKSGEDDFQLTSSSGDARKEQGNDKNCENVRLPGEKLSLSPMIVLQPCPLVFFRDCWGDVDTFRFFWFRLQIHLPRLKVAQSSVSSKFVPADATAFKVAATSRLTFDGEAIPGGYATRLWAFMSHSGHRVLAILCESQESPSQLALYFRGDNKELLYSLLGTKPARKAVVAALSAGMVPVD